MARVLLVALLSIACRTPPAPGAVSPTEDRSSFAGSWLVENHLVTPGSALTEGDAILMHGRKIELAPTSYRSPFQGRCDDATVGERARSFDDVTAEVDLAGDRRVTAQRFGMTPTVEEYRLTCRANDRTPPLVLFVAGRRAMTCFSGVCYLMTPG